ncbi:MAG: hypothetical protein EOP39_02035 [Rubrivivax sp.]|nr:MAG: hypothetical protein EOP39_02035 [Rubrivivax sp.]
MTSSAFDAALPFTLRWEGGFVDHPADPGGATNKGVTQKVYDTWRRDHGQASRTVRELEDGEMRAIYEAGYWTPARCPALDSPLDLLQFDTAVNMGIGRAVRFLQKAVGASVDGDFGPGTKKCVDNCDPGDALIAYCNAREAFYRQLVVDRPQMGVFLKGWMNRLNALRKAVGLPGFESASDEVDFGDAGYIARVPDDAP